MVQTVSHIQPDPVDVKLFDPSFDRMENVLYHIFIMQVQLDQIVIAFPAFIPQAVIIIGVAAEINTVKPVYVRRRLPIV